MKLNNKGFAFTTLLYGVLALIVVILFALLNILKTSSDEEYYYGEIIKEKLDECIYEELALEDCYSKSGNNNCDGAKSIYDACLGLTSLSEEVIRVSVGNTEIVKEGDTYKFTGLDPKNYLLANGIKYRIISMTQGGNTILVNTETENYNGDISWNANVENDFGTVTKISISSNIEIKAGKGTKNDPYVVG